MWNPASPTRSALALLMAAAVAFLGSALLLKARELPQLTGGATASAPPGTLLLAVVVLLGAGGVLLLALAAKELLDARRGPHLR